jgi:hypothetical protein
MRAPDQMLRRDSHAGLLLFGDGRRRSDPHRDERQGGVRLVPKVEITTMRNLIAISAWCPRSTLVRLLSLGVPHRRQPVAAMRDFDWLFISDRRILQSAAPPLQGGRVQSQLHKSNGRLSPSRLIRWKEIHMRIQNIVAKECLICGKKTSLAAVEPHPTHPEMELYTFRCVDCGMVRTVSHRRGELPRAA